MANCPGSLTKSTRSNHTRTKFIDKLNRNPFPFEIVSVLDFSVSPGGTFSTNPSGKETTIWHVDGAEILERPLSGASGFPVGLTKLHRPFKGGRENRVLSSNPRLTSHHRNRQLPLFRQYHQDILTRLTKQCGHQNGLATQRYPAGESFHRGHPSSSTLLTNRDALRIISGNWQLPIKSPLIQGANIRKQENVPNNSREAD